MTEKVVIRLINPRPQDLNENLAPAPVVVYYWHRIAAAAAVGILLLAGLVVGVRALFSSPAEETKPLEASETANVASATIRPSAVPAAPKTDAVTTRSPALSATITPEADPSDKGVQGRSSRPSKVHILSRNIRRAQLTSNVVNGEPTDESARVIPMNDQGLVKVYLHMETTGLKGRLLFHDWYWKDKLIAHARVPVKQDKQVLATSKYIDRLMTGPWQVKVVDEQKKVYAQAAFEVQ